MEVPIDSLREQHGQIYCSFIKQVDFLHYPIQNPMSTSPSPLTPSPFVSIYPHVQIVLTCSKTWAKFNIFKFPTGMNVLTLRSWLILCTKTVLRHINQSRDPPNSSQIKCKAPLIPLITQLSKSLVLIKQCNLFLMTLFAFETGIKKKKKEGPSLLPPPPLHSHWSTLHDQQSAVASNLI